MTSDVVKHEVGPTESSSTAGRSAHAEFERRRQRQAERARRRRPLIIAGGLALAVVGLALTLWSPLPGWSVVLLALVLTASSLFALPTHVTAWQTGAEGEVRTARLLEQLEPDGFKAVHDRRISGSRSNIDHVVIGPPGIFIVETKSYGGKLRIQGGEIYVGGRRQTGMIDEAKREARAVQVALADELAAGGWTVTPLICVHRAELPWFRSEVGGVPIVSGRDLVRRLRKAPSVLAPADVERLSGLVETRLKAAVGSGIPQAPTPPSG